MIANLEEEQNFSPETGQKKGALAFATFAWFGSCPWRS